MIQKILKVGDSVAVTIPKKSLKELGLRAGDNVIVEVDKDNRAVKIKPTFKIDRGLVDWTEKFIDKYHAALQELAKR